jgi:hypothetical protein
MSSNTISILDGSTFLVASPNGDIDAGPTEPQGLFYKDMRHLSKWKLRLNGISLEVLSASTTMPNTSAFRRPELSTKIPRFRWCAAAWWGTASSNT